MLPGLALHLRKARKRLLDLAEHRFECVLFDAGIAAEGRERLALAFELLHQIRFQIRTPRDFGDFEQRRERDVMFPRIVLSQEERKALEQIFEAQQGADSFVERILVKDQARSPLVVSMKELQDILMPQDYPRNHTLFLPPCRQMLNLA